MTDGPDEYPAESELPDKPLTAEDIDPFTIDADDFDDINEFAAAEWQATTTAESRVRYVVSGTDDLSVEEIAEIALASKEDVREVVAEMDEEN